MSGLRRVLGRAAQLARPRPQEEGRTKALASSLLTKTQRAARRFQETRGVLLGGSFAKGTWLPKHVDLDYFVKFNPSTSEEDFERIGLEVGATATRGYPQGKKFAQHPYTEATVDGIRVNVVPCYDVKKGEWKSAADRSPFHVKVVEHLPEKVKDQIRMLKLFMHAVGIYGAEIQTQGFSGYVAEVLVMKHGNLEQVLRWFATLNLAADGPAFSLKDPVDEGRDLGVAVSEESLGRMVLASREFLRHPNLAYFGKMAGKAHPSLGKNVVAVVFSHRAMSEDTLWGELRKTSKHVVRHLEVNGFSIARSLSASNNKDRSAFLLLPEFTELPPLAQRIGPTVDRKKDVEAFIASNSKSSRLAWVDAAARVRLLQPRRYVKVTALLTDIVKGRTGPVGASRELEAGMKKSAVVLTGAALARAGSSSQWLRDGIREIASDAIGAG